MKGIFVSYRRDDAAGWAGRLVADLGKQLPDDHVFHDITAIAPGEDFGQAIQRALGTCAVVLVMIGPNWLSARDRRGEPRLDQIDDPVRVEIRVALSRPDLVVVPVLVGGAAMPARDELPDDLGALSARNAAEVSDARWDYDVEQLVRQLTRIPGVVPPRRRGSMVSRLLGLAALAAIALAWHSFPPGKNELGRPAATPTNPVATAEPKQTPAPEQPPVGVATPQTKPEQPPAVVTTPKPQPEKTRAPSRVKPSAPAPTTAQARLDGVWQADYPDTQGRPRRELFDFETRRGDVFGSNWVQGGTGKFALLDGKIEEDRLKFCIQLSTQVRKGDGLAHINYRECFDGIVAGDEIRFIATNYIDHPSYAPETRRFTAQRRSQ